VSAAPPAAGPPHGAGPRPRWRAIGRGVWLESRAATGRLLFFTCCLAVGVAAVVGVGALVGAFEAGLRADSRALLAADLQVSARRPLPPQLDGFFAERPHRRADLLELAAMAASGEQSRLVELKVVSGEYPLYGELVLEPDGLELDQLADDGVLLAPELAQALGLELGDELSLGGQPFRLRGLVVDEPDRLEFQMTLGPRALVTRAGFERTQLGLAQSRVRHTALFALPGDPRAEQLQGLVRELRAQLGDDDTTRLQTHHEAQPNLRRSLGQVDQYLGLVALSSLLLGGIGVSQIVRAWLAGRVRTVAVLRALGLRAREIAGLYLGSVALLALLGCALGALLGGALPLLVRGLAPDLFPGPLATLWQPLAMARGAGLGLAVAVLFSLPPLTALWRVSPAAVLRAEAEPLPPPAVVRFGAPAILVAGVALVARAQGGSWTHGLAFAGGLAVLSGLLWLAARGVSGLSARLPRGRLGPVLEHGLAALARPGAGTSGAVVALGLGVMVVVTMILVESRLGRALREALPADAPSVFLVDVQPDQWEGVRGELERAGARSLDSDPVVMARLRAIDGRAVAELARESRDAGRAAWMFTREQRLTFARELPPDNVVVEGKLWSDPERAEVSVEVDYAEDLGLVLGSVLQLDVQGVPLELHVTSLRTVEWESFGLNFFLVVEPGVLEAAPHFRLAAARLDPPEAELALQTAIARQYPNVTFLRVRPLLEKVSQILGRVATGVAWLGSFTVLTGLVILAGAVGTTALRRAREAALLKALGVSRGGVRRLFAVEFALTGLVAGAIGSGGALALTYAFTTQVAQLDLELPWLALPLAALTSAALSTLAGLVASQRALAAPPLESLRG
jgi:putative ABC transport system permease protein